MAKSNLSSLEISQGDRIRITGTRRGWSARGTVKTANNYGGWNDKGRYDDWYIELVADEYGYLYWKQSIDGGTVSKGQAQ